MEQIQTFSDDYGMSSEDPYILIETIKQQNIDTTEHNKESLESTLSKTITIVNTFEIEIQTEANSIYENQLVSSSTTISDNSESMRSLDSDKRSNSSRKKTVYKTNEVKSHSGKKKLYECDFCEKKISNLSNLIVHERLHTGEKPFQCVICKKTFTHNSNCVTHMRIHTGYKPFECDICEQKFSHSSNLKTHKKAHFRKAISI